MAGTQFADREQRAKDVRRSATPPGAATSPAMVVGHAFDPAERHADELADQVLTRLRSAEFAESSADTAETVPVRRASDRSGAEAVVGREGGPLPSDVSGRIERARGGGAPLDPGVRTRMESAFGTSLGSVRVHDDAESATLNRMISARAFTTGQDIFFGAGEYRPDTPGGEHVLAHELAHTRQQEAGARRIHRWWDFSQPKFDWGDVASMRTFKSRLVWFMTDHHGDDMVVKMENQPIGLAQLAGEMHGSFASAASVLYKKLDDNDRADIAGLLADASVAKGQTWADFAGQMKWAPFDPTGDLVAQGRRMARDELLNPSIHHNLVAMTLAPGQDAEAAAKPNGGDGSSLFRTRLDNTAHARQLGEVAAVDLFLGNSDRVTAGNMGNWFYQPNGAITLIDHVDQGSQQGAAFLNNSPNWKTDAGDKLAAGKLADTAKASLAAIARRVKVDSGDDGFKTWLDEVDKGVKRSDRIEANLVEGMKSQRTKLIKVFTSTRFTIGGRKDRKMKKSLKAEARKASQADTDDKTTGQGTPQYYEILKERAKWLEKH